MKFTPGPWMTYGLDDDERVVSHIDSKGKERTLAHVYSEADASLIAAAPDSIKLLIQAYYTLADIHIRWPGRDTMKGQLLLCSMRDNIAAAIGMDSEAVQNGEAVQS